MGGVRSRTVALCGMKAGCVQRASLCSELTWYLCTCAAGGASQHGALAGAPQRAAGGAAGDPRRGGAGPPWVLGFRPNKNAQDVPQR